MVSIYALINPINEKVFYIGCSKNPFQRMISHIYPMDKSKKNKEIECIQLLGLQPELLILDTVPKPKARFWEEFYMELFLSFGFCLTNEQRHSNYSVDMPLGISLPKQKIDKIPPEVLNRYLKKQIHD